MVKNVKREIRGIKVRSFFEISEELDVLLAENKWQEVLNLLGNIQEYLSEEEFNQSEFARKVYQANAKMMLGKWEDVMMLLKKVMQVGFPSLCTGNYLLNWRMIRNSQI